MVKVRKKIPRRFRVKEETVDSAELRTELAAAREALRTTRETLQGALESQEVVNASLNAANDEFLSSNAELQATNEELRTAKQELQLTNAALTTANAELERRNDELLRTNDDLTNLLASVYFPVLMLSGDLKIRRFTPAAARFWHLGPADLGRSLADVASSIDLPDLAHWASVVMDSMVPFEREVRDAAGRWFSLRIQPYRTSDHRIDGVVLLLVDIHALKTSRDLAVSIVETIREPLLVLDPELRVKSANRAFCQVYGIEAHNAVGKKVFDLDDGQWDIPGLRELLAWCSPDRSVVTDFELRHSFATLGEREMLVNACRFSAEVPGMEGLILLGLEDVTERRRVESERLALADRLLASNQELSQFAYVAAHDLQEPLRLISLYMELLAEEAGLKLGEEEMGYVKVASDSAKRMKAMVEGLLRYAKNSHEALDLEQLDCCKVVDDVLLGLSPAITRAEAVVQRGTLPSVRANATLLAQVFQNLVANALKFRRNVPPHVALAAVRAGGEWQFSVEDNGIGIASDNLEKVFRVFHRLHGVDQFPGAGLGLALSKKVVERHGGRMWVESRLGIGSTFFFTLPASPIDERAGEAR